MIDFSWQNIRRIMLVVAFGVVLHVGLQNLNSIGEGLQDFLNILAPFTLGACIAFVVNIPMNFIENKLLKDKKKKRRNGNKIEINKFKRFISILLSVIIILGILVCLLSLLIPELVNVIKTFVQYLGALPAQLTPTINELASNYPELSEELSKLQIDFSNILNTAISFLKNAGSGLIGFVSTAVSVTISSVMNFVIGIIFTFYLLMSKEKIGKNFRRIIMAYLPNKYSKKILEITTLSKEAFSKFITGQLKEALILGMLCYIGMLILQLPYSLTISLLTTITALVPIFGALIGATIGVILLLAVSPIKAITFLIFIVVLQQIETNLIYPRVVGESVGLPGVIVIVAISVGGSLGGPIGMLVSLPIASVVYTLIRSSVSKRLKEKNIDEKQYIN